MTTTTKFSRDEMVAKTEIAYVSYDRDGREKPAKVKVVATVKLAKALEALEAKGYTIYGTRDAE
jgi:hypothetical protein